MTPRQRTRRIFIRDLSDLREKLSSIKSQTIEAGMDRLPVLSWLHVAEPPILRRGDLFLQESPLDHTYTVTLVPLEGPPVLLATRLSRTTALAFAWTRATPDGSIHEVSSEHPTGRTLTAADFA